MPHPVGGSADEAISNLWRSNLSELASFRLHDTCMRPTTPDVAIRRSRQVARNSVQARGSRLEQDHARQESAMKGVWIVKVLALLICLSYPPISILGLATHSVLQYLLPTAHFISQDQDSDELSITSGLPLSPVFWTRTHTPSAPQVPRVPGPHLRNVTQESGAMLSPTTQQDSGAQGELMNALSAYVLILQLLLLPWVSLTHHEGYTWEASIQT